MARITRRALRQNPFTVYRDPKTGQWVVINHSQGNNYQESNAVNA